MITFSDFGRSRLCLGYEGENIVTEIVVDVSDELRDGWTAGLILRRPDGATYPAAATVIDGVLRYNLTATDLAVRGQGIAMIALYGVNGEIKKSARAVTVIADSLPIPGAPEPPEPVASWVINATILLNEASQAMADMLDSQITEAAATVDNTTGTPSVAVSLSEASEGGQKISFAFEHIKGADGTDGTDGRDGTDGFSPSASVERVEGGAVITITDKDGTTVAEVYDGQGGGGGTSDYNDLSNRPKYNGATMTGSTNIPVVKTDTWDAKQDEISDLATIRSGAEAGATAVQPEAGKGLFSGNYADLTNKPTIPDKLSDLSQDSTHRVVTDVEKATWNGKYTKPSGGIQKTDLAEAVRTSLGLADSALQEHQSLAAYRTADEQDTIDGGKLDKSAQAVKTDAMTQAVGIDEDGKLWTTPGGSGGGMVAQVIISAQNGAVVTATKGSLSVTGTVEAGNTVTLNLSQYGEWTITAGYLTETITKNIIIDDVKQYSMVFQFGKIYGVEWGRVSSPVWTRTDDAALFTDPVPYLNDSIMTAADCSSPFDDIMPWAGMVRVSDPEAGELVAIPKFYYKWDNDASKMKLQISTSHQVGYLVSPAHMDRGDGKGERDVVYIGRYHCATSNYKSSSGEKPKTNITRATARTAIHDLGENIWQLDHALWWTIDMLYLVEYANSNCQGTIGYGRGNGSSTENMGYTDTMPYHTGSMKASKTEYGVSTQYRNIEGLWDNVVDWCDGIYFSGANVYHIINPAQFSDNANGTLTGQRATVNDKVITGFTFPNIEGFEWAGYPGSADVGANTTTGSDYFCDNEYYNASGVVLSVGGGYSQDQYGGLFCRSGYDTAPRANASIGVRLQKLP